MSHRFLVSCCDTMQQMMEQNLIQWKQKLNFQCEGVYFCPPETTRCGATARRCGKPLKNCPYCTEKMPTTAQELEDFNERMRNKQVIEVLA